MDTDEYLREYMEALGGQFREERRHQGLNQDAAAERAGLHRRTISDIENGKNGNIKTLVRYAMGLEVEFALIAARAELALKSRRLTLEL